MRVTGENVGRAGKRVEGTRARLLGVGGRVSRVLVGP